MLLGDVYVLDTPVRSWHTADLVPGPAGWLREIRSAAESKEWPAPLAVDGRTAFEQPNLLLQLRRVSDPPEDQSTLGLFLGGRAIAYATEREAKAIEEPIAELQTQGVAVWCRAKFVPARPETGHAVPWLLYETDEPSRLRAQLDYLLR